MLEIYNIIIIIVIFVYDGEIAQDTGKVVGWFSHCIVSPQSKSLKI